MASVVDLKCINCSGTYNPTDLYCAYCGYILPHALTNEHDRTRSLDSARSNSVDLQWGTGYFHHRAKLFFRFADGNTVIPVPLLTPTVIIGRNSDNATVDLDLTPFNGAELGVSRRHVRIERVRDVLQATDLESANGTFLNREKLTPGTRYTLRNRAVLQLGKMILRIQFA